MKKSIICVICVLALAFSLAACRRVEQVAEIPTAEPTTVTIVNPVTEYFSLEELNAACGAKLSKLAETEVTNESFSTIDGDGILGEYKFNIGENEICVRFAANFDNDISGVYVDGASAFKEKYNEETVATDEYRLSRWITVDGQYVVIAPIAFDEKEFDSVVKEFRERSTREMTEQELTDKYNSLSGEYQDSVSQRATATVEGSEDGIKITVTWASSATENSVWTMTATLGEDGLYNYRDCEHSTYDFSESEDGVKKVISTKGEGFFSLDSTGALHWSGAQDENCRKCIFEKVM
ncbi:MAG: hypothetical protein K6B52_06695 [Clostridiales bacterium]|nr:hypothetical protein [Clostridiales bacterium]